MAKKEKLISGFENLFSSPNLQSVLGQLGNSGGYTPTADALSVPFGVTFEQGQQLVKNAIDRDTTAAAIESEKMRTKAEQERIKVAREGLDLEKQREAKNDLTESEELARTQQFAREQGEKSHGRALDLENKRVENQKQLTDYGIESQINNAERVAVAEGKANAARIENDPYAKEEFDLNKKAKLANINQSNAQAEASRASAAYYKKQQDIQAITQEIAQIEKVMLLEQKANGVVSLDTLNKAETYIDSKAEDYETFNMETGKEGVQIDIKGAVRKVEYGALIESGALNWRSVKHHFDLEEQAEFAEWEQVKKSGDPEKISAWNFKSLQKEQEVYRQAEAKRADQQRLINEAAGGGAPPAGAAIGSKPGAAPTGRQPLPGEGMPNNGYPHPIVTEVIDPAIEELMPLAQSFADTIGMGVDEMLNALGMGTEPSKSIANRIKRDNANRRAGSNWPVENMDISGTAKKVLGR